MRTPDSLVLLLAVALACSGNTDVSAPPTNGTLEITTATTGAEPDPDGFTVQVDGNAAAPIASTGTVTRTDISAGPHTVLLADVAPNCNVTGENPHGVVVTAGTTTSVTFGVSCSATIGDLIVSISNSGPLPDPDGYTISVDNGTPQPIGFAVTDTVPRLVVGTHSVQLGDLAANCSVTGENPRMFTMVGGSEVPIDFMVSCTQMPPLHWQAMESGVRNHLNAVWGSGPTDVYAVGDSGGGEGSATIIHYDGHTWSRVLTEAGITLMGIWGSGPNDVYAVGGGGVNAVIRHFDGRAWTTVTPDLGVMQPFLLSIWGLSSVDMFAVGKHFESDVGVDQALLLRGNGSAWTFMGLGENIERIPHDVSGASAQDVYAVGNFFPAHGSFILHFDGTEWAWESTSFGQEVLNGVWASSATDVFVVGGNADGGVILHFDGHHGWASMRAPALLFNDIWGSSAADIYAVGTGIAHYDGQTWTTVSYQGGRGVWGSSPTDVFVVGADGTILHGSP